MEERTDVEGGRFASGLFSNTKSHLRNVFTALSSRGPHRVRNIDGWCRQTLTSSVCWPSHVWPSAKCYKSVLQSRILFHIWYHDGPRHSSFASVEGEPSRKLASEVADALARSLA